MYKYFMGILKLGMAVLLGYVVSTLAYASQPTSGQVLEDVSFFSMPADKLGVKLKFSKSAQLPKMFSSKSPNRIWLDFPNTSNKLKKKTQNVNLNSLHKLVAVEASGRTRVILDLRYPAKYSLNRTGKELVITLTPNKGSMLESSNSTKKYKSKKFVTTNHSVTGIDFRGTEKHGGKLELGVSDENMGIDVQRQGNNIIVNMLNTSIPNRLVYQYDVKDFGSPVENVKVNRKGKNTQLVLAMNGPFEHLAYQVDKKFIVDVNPISKKEQSKLIRASYNGKRVSLNFQDIKVRAVLQLLADFTGINIVVSDSVTGNITLRLKNVPWDQALDIILKTRGLAKRQIGSVMMIAPSAEISAQEKQELKSKTEVTELEPLISELIQVNYAEAANLAKLLKAKDSTLLSTRGNVSVDIRTNNLWVQDTAEKVAEVRRLVNRLDIPVKQVLIEARIVSVKKDFEHELGIRWGVTDPKHLSGTLEGANQMLNNGGDAAAITPLSDRLNVDLGARGDSAATLGIALARLGKDFLLDLELSAMEKEERGDVIASPRLLTANQSSARIENGEEIPYQQATSSGATSVTFKKAVLSLEVTPQITPDSKLILHLDIHQDTPDRKVEFNNIPAILTKQIQTSVLVNNGETIVLGGIYKQDSEHNIERVPFFGSIPIIGALFRYKKVINNREELLIFITPKIMSEAHA